MITLPVWPDKCIAVLSTVDERGPHAIPVTAPVRGDDATVFFALHNTRGSLARLRRRDQVALTLLAEEDTAYTFRGRATARQAIAADPRYVAVHLQVEAVDDHRSNAYRVTAGVGREWLDSEERQLTTARISELKAASAR